MRTCLDASRDARQLCVVETPADQAALERTGSYRGLYFVLMGRLSPLDGVGVRDIGVAELLERAADPAVEEVILATELHRRRRSHGACAAEALQARGLKVTRLARGVPVGSELEYVDLSTIAHALVRPALSRPELRRAAAADPQRDLGDTEPPGPAPCWLRAAAVLRGHARCALSRTYTHHTRCAGREARAAAPTLFHCATCAALTP